LSKFFQYGTKVDGYDVLVINEREARAAAGILFALGILSLTNAIMLGHIAVTRYFIAFFTFDFLIRVINPNYSPSLLMGRFFVRNQIPEYVGAIQKRFAWSLGLMLAIPMFYELVVIWSPSPMNVFVCIICLVLLICESAFSICFGCMIYDLIFKEKSKNCPGGACEMRYKDPIQKFNLFQATILITTTILLFVGTYSYIYKLDNKTFFSEVLTSLVLSDEELKAQEDERFSEASKEFEDEDF
jgi:hypothetical protein